MNKTFRISEFLSEDRIVFFEPGTPKPQILSRLLATLKVADPQGALAALEAREAVGSTVIVPGLVVPHARIAGLDRIQAAVGFVKGGSAQDPREPRIWLLFLSPADNMRDHLAFLAGVSALFQEEQLVQMLPTLPKSSEVLARIKTAEGGN